MTHLHFDSTYGDCNAYCRDRCKLRVTETGAPRKAGRETAWTEKGQKDICIVFLGVVEGVFPPVHPTFMPIKQLELKH